jgi:hypothetical protein
MSPATRKQSQRPVEKIYFSSSLASSVEKHDNKNLTFEVHVNKS